MTTTTVDWRQRRVWVTGGSGVIGRELLRRLVARGAIVWSTDLVALADPALAGVQAVAADLAAADLTPVARFQPQVIFHLAASFERTREAPEFWETNYRNNVVASHRVVELARGCRSLQTFVFASSYLVYAPRLYLFDTPPVTVRALQEDDLVAPRNLCGAAKFYTETELTALAGAGVKARTVAARIYRVYGRGSRDVIGRWVDDARQRIVLDVYHPANRFDFIYAGDVAEGCLRLAEAPIAEGVVNLGSGVPHRIGDVVEIVQRLLPGVQVRETEASEPVEASVADLTRLERWTGWHPATSLGEGIARLVDGRDS